MADNYFDKNYVDYWKQRVATASDGSKVAADDVARFFIDGMHVTAEETVLDLGCGHGRFYPLLATYTKQVHGVEINEATLKEAARYPYASLTQGSAENTNLSSDMFDAVVAWAVYDVVEQEEGLREENRILKNGGRLLITGKNMSYIPDDEAAAVAERNARMKGFPNHFTDVYALMEQSRLFGFDVVAAFGFPRRGDFGNLVFIDLVKEPRQRFYEFLMILKKVGPTQATAQKICFSKSDHE